MGACLFLVTSGAESKLFDLAFHRFLEIRGRVYCDPAAHCALRTIAAGPFETKVVTLWSRRAAGQFQAFWPRYRKAFADVPQQAAAVGAVQER